MGGHTPTPWRLNAGNEIQIMGATQCTVSRAECGGMSGIKLAEAEANARRIVAAVNATADIPVEALEAGVVAKLVGALEWLEGYLRDTPHHNAPAAANARSALALVKGDAA